MPCRESGGQGQAKARSSGPLAVDLMEEGSCCSSCLYLPLLLLQPKSMPLEAPSPFHSDPPVLLGLEALSREPFAAPCVELPPRRFDLAGPARLKPLPDQLRATKTSSLTCLLAGSTWRPAPRRPATPPAGRAHAGPDPSCSAAEPRQRRPGAPGPTLRPRGTLPTGTAWRKPREGWPAGTEGASQTKGHRRWRMRQLAARARRTDLPRFGS